MRCQPCRRLASVQLQGGGGGVGGHVLVEPGAHFFAERSAASDTGGPSVPRRSLRSRRGDLPERCGDTLHDAELGGQIVKREHRGGGRQQIVGGAGGAPSLASTKATAPRRDESSRPTTAAHRTPLGLSAAFVFGEDREAASDEAGGATEDEEAAVSSMRARSVGDHSMPPSWWPSPRERRRTRQLRAAWARRRYPGFVPRTLWSSSSSTRRRAEIVAAYEPSKGDAIYRCDVSASSGVERACRTRPNGAAEVGGTTPASSTMRSRGRHEARRRGRCRSTGDPPST